MSSSHPLRGNSDAEADQVVELELVGVLPVDEQRLDASQFGIGDREHRLNPAVRFTIWANHSIEVLTHTHVFDRGCPSDDVSRRLRCSRKSQNARSATILRFVHCGAPAEWSLRARISEALVKGTGSSMSISIYLMILAAISFIATSRIKNRRDQDLNV